jgi:dipeptidase
MEIFGPGEDWTPDSHRPGGVWCAQRVPDNQVGCTANRSRIGAVDLSDSDHFIASTNIFSLGEQMGFWKPGKPFIWRQVYGGPGDRSNSLREWRALSLMTPSKALKVTGDPDADRYPFSVTPDQPVAIPRLIETMRDCYEGTEFDITSQSAFKVNNEKSPLACPWGPPELLNLVGAKAERSICTPSSGYVFVAQLRGDLPPALGNLLWFAYGPADTSCFLPIYAGVTDLPESWDKPADFARIDRQQAQWNFRLVNNLSQRLPYQRVINEVKATVKPAEKAFFDLQPEVEKKAASVWRSNDPKAAEAFLTAYTSICAKDVGNAYSELVDYLMLKFLVGDPEFAQRAAPRVRPPILPVQ